MGSTCWYENEWWECDSKGKKKILCEVYSNPLYAEAYGRFKDLQYLMAGRNSIGMYQLNIVRCTGVESENVLIRSTTYDAVNDCFSSPIRHLATMNGQLYYRHSMLEHLVSYVKSKGIPFNLCCKDGKRGLEFKHDGFSVPYHLTPFKSREALLEGIMLSLPDGVNSTVHELAVSLNCTSSKNIQLWGQESKVKGEFIISIGECYDNILHYD